MATNALVFDHRLVMKQLLVQVEIKVWQKPVFTIILNLIEANKEFFNCDLILELLGEIANECDLIIRIANRSEKSLRVYFAASHDRLAWIAIHEVIQSLEQGVGRNANSSFALTLEEIMQKLSQLRDFCYDLRVDIVKYIQRFMLESSR